MKAEINKYVYCLMLLCVIGCKTNDTNLSSIITSPNCYWDVHDAYSSANNKVGYCYKFNKDGRCLYLFALDKKGKRDEYDDDDAIVPKEWKVKGDSVIYIRGIERRVVIYSQDTILLENPVTKERDTLIKNCK